MTIETMTLATDNGLALPVLASLPAGCLAFTAIDASCEPIVQAGERLAIDVTDREPVEGALYLRRYCPPDRKSTQLDIVEALLMRTLERPEGYWLLGPHRPMGGIIGAMVGGHCRVWCDGPFELEGMHGRIVGRVVAIVDAEAAQRVEGHTASSSAGSHPTMENEDGCPLSPSYLAGMGKCTAVAL